MNSNGSQYKASGQVFEQTAIHDAQSMRPSEKRRIEDTLAMIPSYCKSLLEVGCGSSSILNRVEVPCAFGTDLVRRGLRLARRPVVVSSIYALPFADNSVDTVLCAEALEHLEPDTLPEAVAELKRVARSHVVITVPNQEDLLFSSHSCPVCGQVFHINGHLSSFGETEILKLMGDVVTSEFSGSWPVRPFSPTLLKLRTKTLGLWKYTRHTMCPSCRNTRIPNHEGKVLYRLIAGLNDIINPVKSKSNWLLGRFDLK
jgi:Methyltransferase domain